MPQGPSLLQAECINLRLPTRFSHSRHIPPQRMHAKHIPTHPEISHDTPSLTTHYTSILDLRGPGVTVHLTKLQLRLCASAGGKGCVADYVAEGLSRPLLEKEASGRSDMVRC